MYKSINKSYYETIQYKTTYITVPKIRNNIYKSDGQVTFELYGHFSCTGPLLQIKLNLLSIVLLSGFQRSPETLISPE